MASNPMASGFFTGPPNSRDDDLQAVHAEVRCIRTYSFFFFFLVYLCPRNVNAYMHARICCRTGHRHGSLRRPGYVGCVGMRSGTRKTGSCLLLVMSVGSQFVLLVMTMSGVKATSAALSVTLAISATKVRRHRYVLITSFFYAWRCWMIFLSLFENLMKILRWF